MRTSSGAVESSSLARRINSPLLYLLFHAFPSLYAELAAGISKSGIQIAFRSGIQKTAYRKMCPFFGSRIVFNEATRAARMSQKEGERHEEQDERDAENGWTCSVVANFLQDHTGSTTTGQCARQLDDLLHGHQ